jgi:flagellar basal body-associated protein FliL
VVQKEGEEKEKKEEKKKSSFTSLNVVCVITTCRVALQLFLGSTNTL